MVTRKELANALRFLSIDAIEKSKSGHPGAPMGMADMAEALWRHHLKHNPRNPHWVNRDRFILSNGHASMLQYALLHLSGYDVSIEDIKSFRTLHSKTPGHPEYGHTPGVESTSGPLGQGIAMAVGMALAEARLSAEFNRPEHTIVDHNTYVFLGDGCMMEGISHEACSLAGTLGLHKLIAMYDANNISIDGNIKGWFDEDVAKRFEAYGWHVIRGVDGHDFTLLDEAIALAHAEKSRPTLIICKTHIGYGSPNKVDSSGCHGSPLGTEEVLATRKALDWKAEAFIIPEDIAEAWDASSYGIKAEAQWKTVFTEYAQKYPDLADEFSRRMESALPLDFADTVHSALEACINDKQSIATRIASKNSLEALMPALPELVGGSADLTGSVGTMTKHSKAIEYDKFGGNYIYYGVREFAMGAIMNGMALHGGILPYAGTFMMFSDYAKNAIRLSALMGTHVIWVLTHDSIGVGEDGPTHQPIEQVASLRLIPNVNVWRPCDTVETMVAWKCAISDKSRPHCLSLSRQDLEFMERSAEQVQNIEKGGYILHDCTGTPELIIIATGSEVGLAREATQVLIEHGKKVRLVSMPCTEVFDAQDADYRESVLPSSIRKRLAVEAGCVDYWYKYVGLDGRIVGMNGFGASAPGNVLAAYFGFTLENVLQNANEMLA